MHIGLHLVFFGKTGVTGILLATRTPWTAPYRPVRAADHRSVCGTPTYPRQSRRPCYDGIFVVTAASPGASPIKPEHRSPLLPPPLPRRRRVAPLLASHGQASTHIPSIDPLEPSSATCCSAEPASSPEPRHRGGRRRFPSCAHAGAISAPTPVTHRP
jgi:hypothetical protein